MIGLRKLKEIRKKDGQNLNNKKEFNFNTFCIVAVVLFVCVLLNRFFYADKIKKNDKNVS